jgi:hypothetical protein
VGSPFASINDNAQTEALRPLLEVMPEGLALEDIAFAFTFTTQSVESHIVAVRDGLYGHGVQGHIGRDFPAELATIEPLRAEGFFDDMTNPHVLWAENWIPVFEIIAQEFQGGTPDTVEFNQLMESLQYIDYFVVGSFQSPQLYDRYDEDGEPVPFNDQAWPPDLDLVPAQVRSETVHFMLAVPRKEVSARGDGEPAAIAVHAHGYGSNRFEIAGLAGYFARHGLATISIDGPSHGISVSPSEIEIAELIIDSFGLGPFGDVIFEDRAWDQNGDGGKDSAADFWTAYVFHTRDAVRQYALDLMQLIRILRSFDGQRRWSFDLDGDGQSELAGDFDGDGQVDIGADSLMVMVGGSLGGMMSTVMGGIEPAISATAPIVAAGGLGDLGIRSQQGGVREAFILPVMGPLFIGTLDEAGDLVVETIVTNINNRPDELHLATLSGVSIGDTFVTTNRVTGESGCGYVSSEGTVRTGVASDVGDAIEIRLYEGNALVLGSEECAVQGGRTSSHLVDTFGSDIEHLGVPTEAGSPLVSLMEGLGLRRAHPDLRRFQGLGQLVLDPGDMAVYAQYHSARQLYFPGTQETTGTHSLWIPTVGDMNVPVAGVMTIGRAAGVLRYLDDHPGHGMPDNQVLIDSYTAEGVHNLDRYTDPDGNGIHISPDDWVGDADTIWPWVPRLDPPLRSNLDRLDPLGGISGLMWVYGSPSGSHGPESPGAMIDTARESCRESCEGDDCNCEELLTFDQGNFLFDVAGEYLSSGGTVFDPDICHAHMSCDSVPPPPAGRETVDPRPRNE